MNLYKKFCINFILILVFCLVIISPTLFCINFGVEDAPGRTMDNWFKVKEAYAKKHEDEKKLFVLSCSTCLYGVDSKKLEDALNIPVVNFATTSSLRKYQFDRIKHSLQAGDIVLMPLEYGIYTDQSSFGKDPQGYYIYVMEFDPEHFNKMSTCEKLFFAIHLKPNFLLKRTFLRPLFHEYGDEGDHFLLSKYLNENGDLTSNTYETKFYNKPRITPDHALNLKDHPGIGMQKTLKNFVEYCEKNNIKLYATWQPIYPVTDKNKFYGHDLESVSNIKKFWNSLGVEVLGNYYDAFYSAEDCYNSWSHLNDRGKEKYTKHLIELLKPYVNGEV